MNTTQHLWAVDLHDQRPPATVASGNVRHVTVDLYLARVHQQWIRFVFFCPGKMTNIVRQMWRYKVWRAWYRRGIWLKYTLVSINLSRWLFFVPLKYSVDHVVLILCLLTDMPCLSRHCLFWTVLLYLRDTKHTDLFFLRTENQREYSTAFTSQSLWDI